MRKERKDHSAIAARGLISETEAAKRLNVARGTLAKWRKAGKTPAFEQIHRRLYAYSATAIEAFAATLVSAAVAA